MILEFKTAMNKNGHRKYLCIDTGAEVFSRNCRYMITPGIEIKVGDYNELIKKVERLRFEEVDYAY